MRWPFSKKEQAQAQPLTMQQALAEPRADLAVAEWLMQAMQRDGAQVKEIVAAYRVDRFLQEVNSGGCLGFFNWEFENTLETVDALRTAGLQDVANDLQEAMAILSNGEWFATKDDYEDARDDEELDNEERSNQLDALSEKIIAKSARIESSNHQYIRDHLPAFV